MRPKPLMATLALMLPPPCPVAFDRPSRLPGLGQTEDYDRVTEGVTQLEIAPACHGDELLAAVGERHRRGIASRTRFELPEQLAGSGLVRVEVAVTFAGEREA